VAASRTLFLGLPGLRFSGASGSDDAIGTDTVGSVGSGAT
jgi:hypothetical protein